METPDSAGLQPENLPGKDEHALEMLDGRMPGKLERLGFVRKGQKGEFVRPQTGDMPQIKLSIKQFKRYWSPSIPKHRQIWNGQISQEYTHSSEPEQMLFNAYFGGEIHEADELVNNIRRYLTSKESRMVVWRPG